MIHKQCEASIFYDVRVRCGWIAPIRNVPIVKRSVPTSFGVLKVDSSRKLTSSFFPGVDTRQSRQTWGVQVYRYSEYAPKEEHATTPISTAGDIRILVWLFRLAALPFRHLPYDVIHSIFQIQIPRLRVIMLPVLSHTATVIVGASASSTRWARARTSCA